ncbi:DMT family transporter [Cupriavidus taiwanensis]|uniref:Permease of the drug/metabolite transporter (DMT) superfamily n=1 Tax=Cupriavidus taiwanensis (strain DSM 17343 / BCRC 17206 / CCUG 44338 / CIP 107171 / LMG 19424 / R1) TaxID=977880 RepID=B3R9B0_CUPTR|nr:DMT family transporter [Cupriavidus taiwanensis]CAQ71485.1 putative permease of the drug/metabolite transporter (DMT) superfamily [Cupriavidus taiwanensis LMG 19424]
MPASNPSTRRIDWTTLFLLTFPPLSWAGNAIVGRLAAGTVPPVALNWARWVLAGMLLAPFAWRGVVEHRAVLRRHAGVITAMGILSIASYNALQYLALTSSTPINVTLIGASTPLFLIVIGALCFGERVRPWHVAGALLCMVGVTFVLVRGELARLAQLDLVPGDLYMLAATIAWSAYTWLLRKQRPALPLPVLLFAQIVTGVLASAPVTAWELLTLDQPLQWNGKVAGILLYVATIPSLLAYFAWDRAIARAGAQLPVFFITLTPVFAALLSTVLLGDWPRWYHGVGLAAIAAGIWLAQRR